MNRLKEITELPPGSCVCLLLYLLSIYIRRTSVMSSNDITLICFCILGGKNLCTCTVKLSRLACASANIPDLFPIPCHAWTTMHLLYPNFCTCDTLPQVFQCALIVEPVIYLKKVIIYVSKLCTKIGKINTYNKIDGYNMDGMEINEQMTTTGN